MIEQPGITRNQGHEKMLICLDNYKWLGMAGAQGIHDVVVERDRDQIIKDLCIYLKKRVWVLFLGDWLLLLPNNFR